MSDDETDDFQILMRRIQDGSEEAAWELVERYGMAVRRAVRRVLNARLRPKFDSLDFVQLVWCSFFRRNDRAGQFAHPDQLVAFLAQMAKNKVAAETRCRLFTEQHNIDREYPLFDVQDNNPSFVDPRPAAIDLAIARERWEQIVAEQPARYRRIIQLRLQGLSNLEIAKRMQIAHSTVDRFLERLMFEKLG